MLFFVKNEKKLKYFLPIVLLFWGIFQVIFGEHITANQGLGWDGYRYASLTQHLLESPELDNYTVYRIFLPTVINIILTVFSITVSIKNIIISFHVVHLILLPISGYFFVIIMEHYNLKLTTKLAGIVLCYINFALLRFTHYYPVMMDTPAFSLSIIIFYLFIKQKTVDYLLLGCISAFVFPTLLLQALFLFFFTKPVKLQNRKKINFILLILFFLLLQYLLLKNNMLVNDVAYSLKIQEKYFLLSALVTAFLCSAFITVLLAINVKQLFISYFTKEKLKQALAAILIVGFVFLVSIAINLHEKKSEYMTTTLMLFKFFTTSNAMPGISIVAHTTYFGAAVIMLLLFWRKWIIEANKISFGLLVFSLLMLFKFGVGSESRVIINLLPLLIIPLLLVFDKINLKPFNVFILFVSNLFVSKIWLQLSHKVNCKTDEYNTVDFPCQNFFMHLGPWMSYNAYWIQMSFFFIFVVILILTFRKNIFLYGEQ